MAAMQAGGSTSERGDDWLGKYRKFWEGSFDRMDAYLSEITKAEAKGKKQ